MKKIGIVGLGVMGHGMALNFLKNGYTLTVWNRDAKKADDLVSAGAYLAKTPKELASLVDIVFEITANDESSQAVWLGETGILAGASKEKILIASATLSVSWIDELALKCSGLEFCFLDAPLTGGRIGAESGNLTLLFGGDKKIVDGLGETLKAIAGKVLFFGPVGSGIRYKLILNFLQATHMIGFGQAMKMAKKAKMDLTAVSEALADRPGGVITSIAKTAYFSEPDPVTFSVEWIKKDLSYAKMFANDKSLTLLEDVLAEYEKAMAQGLKSKDWASVNTLLEE